MDQSVAIVNGALTDLASKGIDLNEEEKEDIVKKLSIISCSDHSNPKPVLYI